MLQRSWSKNIQETHNSIITIVKVNQMSFFNMVPTTLLVNFVGIFQIRQKTTFKMSFTPFAIKTISFSSFSPKDSFSCRFCVFSDRDMKGQYPSIFSSLLLLQMRCRSVEYLYFFMSINIHPHIIILSKYHPTMATFKSILSAGGKREPVI